MKYKLARLMFTWPKSNKILSVHDLKELRYFNSLDHSFSVSLL